MFERFTKQARTTVVAAVESAETTGGEVRPGHLLRALLDTKHGPGAAVAQQALSEVGTSTTSLRSALDRQLARQPDGFDQDDADALALIGIDLANVVARVEDRLGRLGHRSRHRWSLGATTFSRSAKKALEHSLDEAVALGHGYIGNEHILLGLARTTDRVVVDTLAESGVEYDALRAAVANEVRRAG